MVTEVRSLAQARLTLAAGRPGQLLALDRAASWALGPSAAAALARALPCPVLLPARDAAGYAQALLAAGAEAVLFEGPIGTLARLRALALNGARVHATVDEFEAAAAGDAAAGQSKH